jgi:hypothetical protein
MEQPGTYKTTERLIPESQLKAIVEGMVKETLAQMLGVNATAQPQKQWYDTEQAYSLLGLNLADQLRDMVRSGLLRIGHEVRDVRLPNSQLARYQFHIEKCEARLALPPEQRQTKKTKKTA